ncbi:MAG: hypothetical protein JW950_14265 [Deltaproteobacteria bacterium]|nr:hypothetical protein [Deltaproteobacteria bacterium]
MQTPGNSYRNASSPSEVLLSSNIRSCIMTHDPVAGLTEKRPLTLGQATLAQKMDRTFICLSVRMLSGEKEAALKVFQECCNASAKAGRIDWGSL